jgi:hypothetical protein
VQSQTALLMPQKHLPPLLLLLLLLLLLQVAGF